jgi:hypothetical protein
MSTDLYNPADVVRDLLEAQWKAAWDSQYATGLPEFKIEGDIYALRIPSNQVSFVLVRNIGDEYQKSAIYHYDTDYKVRIAMRAFNRFQVIDLHREALRILRRFRKLPSARHQMINIDEMEDKCNKQRKIFLIYQDVILVSLLQPIGT